MFDDIQRKKFVMELFSFGDLMLRLIVTKAYEFIWFGGFQHLDPYQDDPMIYFWRVALADTTIFVVWKKAGQTFERYMNF